MVEYQNEEIRKNTKTILSIDIFSHPQHNYDVSLYFFQNAFDTLVLRELVHFYPKKKLSKLSLYIKASPMTLSKEELHLGVSYIKRDTREGISRERERGAKIIRNSHNCMPTKHLTISGL